MDGQQTAIASDGLGPANNFLHSIGLKLFNHQVIPGQILWGIVYFDVAAPVRVTKIMLNIIGTADVVVEAYKRSDSSQVVSL